MPIFFWNSCFLKEFFYAFCHLVEANGIAGFPISYKKVSFYSIGSGQNFQELFVNIFNFSSSFVGKKKIRSAGGDWIVSGLNLHLIQYALVFAIILFKMQKIRGNPKAKSILYFNYFIFYFNKSFF